MKDSVCLAENCVYPTSFSVTGVNDNVVVVGPTGCGKTVSYSQSRLINAFDTSMVVTLSKQTVIDEYTRIFKRRGYKVVNLDFAHPERCSAGYDPLCFIKRDEDIIQLARNLVGSVPQNSKADPYWTDSATSLLAAEIGLIMLNAKCRGMKPCFADVIKLHRALKIEDDSSSNTKTSIDCMFEEAEKRFPGNQASEMWKTLTVNPPRTSGCILSTANNALDKIFTENIIKMTQKDERVSFESLGKEKTVLFITTSPMNKALTNFINIMYADMFRELFEAAEKNANYSLDVPVHVICDDFACGSKIENFEDYISIFRAAGISVSLLLQSESQLKSIYGDYAAVTVLNNCDTYLYMGGMDTDTCRHIAEMANKQLSSILSLPLEQVIVFRRGNKPFFGRRYQTFKDPEYIKCMAENDTRGIAG